MRWMAQIRTTAIWTLETLRLQAARNDRAYAVLLSTVVRTWGYDLALLAHDVTLYTRTYDDDTNVSVLSMRGGRAS
jgi:hypothetical protein